MLMCKKHWFMLPPNIRSAVWRTYRPGQCDDKNPSEEWHVTADAAIGYVAAKEGKPLRQSETTALRGFGIVSARGRCRAES
jgi:hypothetical protein